MNQQIGSFDHLISVRLHSILRANSHVTFSEDPSLYYRLANIRVESPLHNERTLPGCTSSNSPPADWAHNRKPLTAQECRIRQMTYAGRILIDGYFPDASDSSREILQRDIHIGYMPIMLRSQLCHLNGKSPSEMAQLGGCMHDRGGYFVIKGQERVVLIQEQLSENRVIITQDDKLNSLCAFVASKTAQLRSRTTLFFRRDCVVLQHNSFGAPVALCVIMRALGVESDQEIVQLIGKDLIDDLLPSIQSGRELRVNVPVSALFSGVTHKRKPKRADIAGNFTEEEKGATSAADDSDSDSSDSSEEETEEDVLLYGGKMREVPVLNSFLARIYLANRMSNTGGHLAGTLLATQNGNGNENATNSDDANQSSAREMERNASAVSARVRGWIADRLCTIAVYI